MKLLICTQKVDRQDSVLGFFHEWIAEFSKQCDNILVICLEKGEYGLPDNVEVLSLGKENGLSRLKYIYRFYKFIWNYKSSYDKVFVHMNQEYVLLGGLFWKILNKSIYFWRNHPKGSFLTDLAIFFATKSFCTSRFSYTAKFRKNTLMPAGININYFKKLQAQGEKGGMHLLYLGRISPIKDLETLIKAFAVIRKKNKEIFLTIVGGVGQEKDKPYLDKIKHLINNFHLQDRINFFGAVTPKEVLGFYNNDDIYINLTKSGSLDKTTLEAMSCGKLILVCNKSYFDILPKYLSDILIFREGDADDLAHKILALSDMDMYRKNAIKNELRKIVIQTHSLDLLTKKLFYEIR